MRVLALDFDGVLVDSARETFRVALDAYLQEVPTSNLSERDHGELYEPYLNLIPLGNRAEDFGVALAAIEAGLSFETQAAYDEFRDARGADWLERYHERFYRARAALASSDPDGWRGLMRPYETFTEVLRRRAGEVVYAIATSKDRVSVDALLSHYGLADLFREDLILDKETSSNKAVHIQTLLERLETAPGQLTFVDDKVNHLDAVAPLGVRCGLATWGYNGEREHELAARRGYLLLAPDNAERRLFEH